MNIDRTTLPTVRMIDGKEVEKLEIDLDREPINGTENASMVKYNSARVYRYLPTWDEYWDIIDGMNHEDQTSLFEDYHKLTNSSLSLGQFIPIGVDGKPLEKPSDFMFFENGGRLNGKDSEWYTDCHDYQQAEERVIFEGWELYEHPNNFNDDEITDMSIRYKGSLFAIRFLIEDGITIVSYGVTDNAVGFRVIDELNTYHELTYELKKQGIKLILR